MEQVLSPEELQQYRLKMRAEGDRLWVEGRERIEKAEAQREAQMVLLDAESDRLWLEGCKIWGEGSALVVEGDKKRGEASKLWAIGAKAKARQLWEEGENRIAEGRKIWAIGKETRAKSVKLEAKIEKLAAMGAYETDTLWFECSVLWAEGSNIEKPK